MDPTLNWDKAFVSPSSTRKTKSSLNDRATFWPATSTNLKDRACINPYRITSKQPSAITNKVSGSKYNSRHGSKCGVCYVCIDIWCTYTCTVIANTIVACSQLIFAHAYAIESGERNYTL